jgi:hypothetical protein
MACAVLVPLPGPAGRVGRRSVAYGRGGGFARSRRRPAFQRKPERDHEQAEGDDPSTTKVKPTIVVASGQAGCWLGHERTPDHRAA